MEAYAQPIEAELPRRNDDRTRRSTSSRSMAQAELSVSSNQPSGEEANKAKVPRAQLVGDTKKRKKKKKQVVRTTYRKYYIATAIFLLVVVGAILLFLRSSSISSATNVEVITSNDFADTAAPNTSAIKTAAPTSTSLSGSSVAPSIDLLYQPPTEEECEAIRIEEGIPGQDQMAIRTVELSFDIPMEKEIDNDTTLDLLMSRFKHTIVPEIVGCPSLKRSTDTDRRNLLRFRYVIANILLSWTDKGNGLSCEPSVPKPCSRVVMDAQFYFKEKMRVVDFLSFLTGTLNTYSESNPTYILGDSSTFGVPVLANIDIVDITESPSDHPSTGPSTSPSQAPSANPTTSPPTRSPTPNPTKSPTQSPTPSPTPNPTRPPTRPPTFSPTPPPTRSPTLPPTLNPTPPLTPPPTLTLTLAPTQKPTMNPTPPPSTAPSTSPSQASSANPTNSPPTRSPTETPSQAPTMSPPPSTSAPTQCTDVAGWVDGYGDTCNDFAQNSNYCANYGSWLVTNKPTANEACCVCKAQITVNCGGHRASSCAQCPQGNGQWWCNGECSWINNNCVSSAP